MSCPRTLALLGLLPTKINCYLTVVTVINLKLNCFKRTCLNSPALFNHPWVWPPPHNYLPLQSRPAITAEGSLLHELPQGWLGGIHSRVREEICSKALLVAPVQAGWQEVEAPTEPLNRIRGKDPLQLKGDCKRIQQVVYCLFSPTRLDSQGLMREVHRQHPVDPSYRSFNEKGVAAAIRKVGSSTTQGPDGLTMVPFHHGGARVGLLDEAL